MRPLASLLLFACGCSAANNNVVAQPCDTPGPAALSATASWDHLDEARADCQFRSGDHSSASIAGAPSLGMVKHVVVILRENRSFDHYFSSYMPTNGQTVEVAPADASNPDPAAHGAPVARTHESRYCIKTPNHEFGPVHLQLDNGRLDGFVAASNDSPDSTGGARAMGYYDESDIPLYYWLARNFALSDRYFSSLLGPTHPNQMFYFFATSCGYAENIDTNPGIRLDCGMRRKSIFSLLDDQNVDYRLYSDNPEIITSAAVGLGAYNPLHGVSTIADFEAAAAADRLPRVVFVEPNYYTPVTLGTPNDEHPPTNLQDGQAFTFRVLTALMSNPAVWQGTVAFITWDEHGGYYDHVLPPAACVPDDSTVYDFAFDRYGFRVPLLAVSPFARSGYVGHAIADHTSILRFIEHWLDLPALTNRDANAWPLLDLFDFDHPNTVGPPDAALAAVSMQPAHVDSCHAATAPTGAPQ